THTIIAHHGIQPLREGLNKFHGMGRLRSLANLLIRITVTTTIGNIVGDRIIEQSDLLVYQRNLTSKRRQSIVLQQFPVQQDLTTGVVVETRDQVHQSRLATARPPYQCNGFAGRNLKANVMKYVRALRRIAEADLSDI